MHFLFKREELFKRHISQSDVTVLQLLQGQRLAVGRAHSQSWDSCFLSTLCAS